MVNVFITYTDDKIIEKVTEQNSVTFHFIDMLSLKGKKEGFSLKSYWGAKLDPFILVKDGDIAIKAFYAEEKKDIIQEMNKFIKSYVGKN